MAQKTCLYYLTYKCNDFCEFHQIWNDNQAQAVENAPVNVHIQNLADARKAQALNLEIVGGEPFLYDDLPQFLRQAKAMAFKICLTTNGILYRERANKIQGLVDNLFFYLDYPIEEEHNRSRGVESYNDVLFGIRFAHEMGERPGIVFTLTRDNVRFMPEMVELSEKLRAKLYVRHVEEFFGAKGFENMTYEHIKYYFKRQKVVINLAEFEFLKNHGNKTVFPRCKAKETTITYLPDGKKASPCFFNNGGRQGRENICYGCTRNAYMLPSFKIGFDRYRFLDWYSCWLNDRKSA